MNTRRRILHMMLTATCLMFLPSMSYANSYTINFVGGEGSSGSMQTLIIDEENQQGILHNGFTMDDKVFAGWSVYNTNSPQAQFFEGDHLTYDALISEYGDGDFDLTFYAQWIPLPDNSCEGEITDYHIVITDPRNHFPYDAGDNTYIPLPSPNDIPEDWRNKVWDATYQTCFFSVPGIFHIHFRPEDFIYTEDIVEQGTTEYNNQPIHWDGNDGYADDGDNHYKLTVVNYIRRRLPDVIVTQEMIDNDARIDKFNTPNCGLVDLEFPLFCHNTFGVGTTSAMRVTKYHCEADENYYEDTVYYKVGEIEPEIINRTITVLPWDVNNGSVDVIASDPEHTTDTHTILTFHPIYNTQNGTVTLPTDEASEVEGDWAYTGDDQTLYKMHYTVEFVGYIGRRVDHAYVYEWENLVVHEEPGYIGMPYPDATLKYYIGDGITTTDKNGSPITVRCGTGTIISGVEGVWIYNINDSYNFGGIEIPTGIYRTEDAVFHSDTITNLHYCPQAHSADSTIYTTSDHIEREIGKTFYVNQSPYDNVSFIDEPQPGSQQYKMYTFDILRVVNGYHVNYAMNNPNMTGMPQSFWVTEEQALPANPFQLAGHVFAGWQIDGSDIKLTDQQTVSFSILQNLTHSTNTEIGLIPTWAKTYTISTKVEDEDHTEDPSIGSVNISVGGIPVVGNDTTVTGGTSVQLEAVTTEGGCYQFVRWDDNNTQNPRTIEVTDNINLTAQYKIVKYTIKTQVKPDGDNVHGTTSAEIVNE